VISFGVIKGLIYRVHKYPILASTNEYETTSYLFPTRNQYHLVVNKYTGMAIHPDIIPYLDGKHHYDEICTDLECSPQELDEQLGCISQQRQFNESNTNATTINEVDTVYEGLVEDSNKEGQPQWNVQFIFR
jgi:hypothetical protein